MNSSQKLVGEKLKSHSTNCSESSDFCLSSPVMYHLVPPARCVQYTPLCKSGGILYRYGFEKYVAPTIEDRTLLVADRRGESW